MTATSRALVFVLWLAGCTCDDAEEARPATAGATADEPEATAAPIPPSPPATEAPRPDVEVGGLTVRRLDDGRIELQGTDRWGGTLDTTYESADYLEAALPVLERSITEEQAAALRGYVDTLD